MAIFLEKEAFTFSDVLLVPQRSDLQTRSDADVSTMVAGWKLDHPIISANMDTVTDLNMAVAMGESGGMGILHRFQPVRATIDSLKRLNQFGLPAVPSVGVGDDSVAAAKQYREFTHTICLDVAHGHSYQAGKMVRFLSRDLGFTVIAGNVCTLEGALFLREAGAEVVKVGVGCGAICQTRGVTGHGFPQLSAILDVAAKAEENDYKVIADGGITGSGDIVKALAAGAHAVMVGSLFAGCPETPNPEIYRGMASAESQMAHKGFVSNDAPEGVSFEVAPKPPVKEVLKQLCGGIRSGMSYSGVRTLRQLRKEAIFVKVTGNTVIENSTRKPT